MKLQLKLTLMAIVAGVLFSPCGVVTAKVTPGSMITDNMVLPQNTKACIYGTADAGNTVTVTPSWNQKEYTAKADKTGRWALDVDTPAGSYTLHTITISDGTPVTLDNILIGEVWLASGQSNMEMPLKGFWGCCIEGGYDEVATAAQRADKIRFYTVPLSQSYTPVESVDAAWTVPSPRTAPEYSALGWYFAKRLNDVLDVPIGIVRCAFGGAKVESWMPREILETYPDVSLDPADIEAMTHYHRPMVMYNAMFNPVKDYSYNGIIWYQGCSNVGGHADYPTRLADMVKHWREEIGEGEIPFYSVEIAPYEYNSNGQAPLLREAQWKATEMIPNAGIVCTNDLVKPYERFNIHPADKSTLGKRLGDLALNRTYGHTQFPVEGPTYKSHSFKDGVARVVCDLHGSGFCRNYQVEGFEVAGPDKVFYPIDALWLEEGGVVAVKSSKVPEPVAVRYGWKDFHPGNMHGANYLPLVPFRTDDW